MSFESSAVIVLHHQLPGVLLLKTFLGKYFSLTNLKYVFKADSRPTDERAQTCRLEAKSILLESD